MSKFSLRPIIRDTEATCDGASVATGLSARLQRFRTRRKQMNDGLLALIEREVLGWPAESARRHTGAAGVGAGLGSTGDRLQVWPQGAQAHPRHRRGGPRVPEGDPRRVDLRRTGETARGWIRGCHELPCSGAGRRARDRGTLSHKLRAITSSRRPLRLILIR